MRVEYLGCLRVQVVNVRKVKMPGINCAVHFCKNSSVSSVDIHYHLCPKDENYKEFLHMLKTFQPRLI